MKTGVLLLNFGGPNNLAEVKPFLYRLFADPAVLVGVPTPLRQILAFFIAQVKGGSSIEAYRSIGGSSPQLKWTEAQAAGLRKLLDERAFRVEIGMLLNEPRIEKALIALKAWGAERLVLLPLFPQFSTTTTGSCFTEVKRSLKALGWSPALKWIESWPDHPGYIQLLRATLDEVAGDASHILFSAHSLPMKIVERGDPYPEQVRRTIEAVTRDLKRPWSLSYQSRNGKMPWLAPYTEDEIARLGREGKRSLAVVPVSFVSDHIETLYELDLLYADLARKNGIESYRRARSFNDDPAFARLLGSLVQAT